MADTFTFELVSPERLLASGAAQTVVLPGADGDMGIYGSHAPVMTTLRPGLVQVEMEGGETQEYFVRGGFADVTPDSVTVLAEYSTPRSDLTREQLEEERRIAQANVDKAHEGDDDDRKANAQGILDQLTHLEGHILPA